MKKIHPWIKQHSELYKNFNDCNDNEQNIIISDEFLLQNLTVSNNDEFVKVLKCFQYWLCKYNEEIICYALNNKVEHLYEKNNLQKDTLYKLNDGMIYYRCNVGLEEVTKYLHKKNTISINYIDENNKLQNIKEDDLIYRYSIFHLENFFIKYL